MVFGIGDVAFTGLYLFAVFVIVLYVISRVMEKYAGVNIGGFFSRKDKGEKKIEAEEQAERALSSEEHAVIQKEVTAATNKLGLIKTNLELAPNMPGSQAQLSQVINQIVVIIEQEIDLVKQHIGTAQNEIGIIVAEVEDIDKTIKEENAKLSQAQDDLSKVKIQKIISEKQKLRNDSNNKIRSAKDQLDILQKLGALLGIKWRLIGKTQLSQAKKEQELVSKGNDPKKILNIAQFLFKSEVEILKISKDMQGIRTSLDAAEAQSEQDEREVEAA